MSLLGGNGAPGHSATRLLWEPELCCLQLPHRLVPRVQGGRLASFRRTPAPPGRHSFAFTPP